MKISRAEAWLHSMRMTEPYAIAYQSADTAVNVFFRLETTDGVQGYGCAAPDVDVTGETPEQVLAALSNDVTPSLIGQDPLRSAALLNASWLPSVKHAVDMALLDLLGQVTRQPLWRLFGGYRESVPTSVTIGILSEKETVERAAAWVKQGFTILKIKGGIDWELDAARVMKIREVVGPEIVLRFDANQGYSAAHAILFCARIESARLQCLEQPTSAGNWEALAQVGASTRLRIMADESLLNTRDAVGLAQARACSLFNIKLTKVGGSAVAREMLAIAHASQIGVMIGCMDESALGISAGLSLALSSPVVEFADLDGHIGLIDDPFASAVRLQNGVLKPSGLPGWGAVLR